MIMTNGVRVEMTKAEFLAFAYAVVTLLIDTRKEEFFLADGSPKSIQFIKQIREHARRNGVHVLIEGTMFDMAPVGLVDTKNAYDQIREVLKF